IIIEAISISRHPKIYTPIILDNDDEEPGNGDGNGNGGDEESGLTITASSILIPATLIAGVPITGVTYTYTNSNSIAEAIEPPHAEMVVINTGDTSVGSSISASLYNLSVPNGEINDINTVFKWYRCSNKQISGIFLEQNTS